MGPGRIRRFSPHNDVARDGGVAWRRSTDPQKSNQPQPNAPNMYTHNTPTPKTGRCLPRTRLHPAPAPQPPIPRRHGPHGRRHRWGWGGPECAAAQLRAPAPARVHARHVVHAGGGENQKRMYASLCSTAALLCLPLGLDRRPDRPYPSLHPRKTAAPIAHIHRHRPRRRIQQQREHHPLPLPQLGGGRAGFQGGQRAPGGGGRGGGDAAGLGGGEVAVRVPVRFGGFVFFGGGLGFGKPEP